MNDQIINCFEQLYQKRLHSGKEWNAKAYLKAIESIRNAETINSIDQVKNLPGIGKKMLDLIQEILDTGTISELDNPDNEKQKILELFDSVQRVGPTTALKWYNLGYRKLEDIKPEHCTRAQKICLELKSELDQRIPRSEAELIEQAFHDFLDPKGIPFIICGSYRRNKPDCGDIDILIKAEPDRDLLAEAIKCPILTHMLVSGKKKYQGIGKILDVHRRIDIELCKPSEYPFTLLYFTGPESFNVKMRDYCSKHELRLNEKGLYGLKLDETGKYVLNGLRYPANSEEHIFEMLGLQYLDPIERDQY